MTAQAKLDDKAVGERVKGILSGAKIPDWLIPAAESLVLAALHAFGVDKPGQAKAFVRDGLIKLAEQHDIPWLPNGIERPIEEALISVVVDVVWSYIVKELPQLGAGFGPMSLAPAGS